MGRDFREVAKEITSALNLGEDEGKIDALAGSLEDAANKSFVISSDTVANYTPSWFPA